MLVRGYGPIALPSFPVYMLEDFAGMVLIQLGSPSPGRRLGAQCGIKLRLRTFLSTGSFGYRLFGLRAGQGIARAAQRKTDAADVFVHRLSGLRAVQNGGCGRFCPQVVLATGCSSFGLGWV